jgi:hypothetical protein
VLLAVSVRVLVPVAGFGLNEAVTPRQTGAMFLVRIEGVAGVRFSRRIEAFIARVLYLASRMVKKLKRVEIAQLAAFHRLTSNGLPRRKNSAYNFAFTGLEIRGQSKMLWARMLAYIAGTVDQELLLRNEYLAAENRIRRAQFCRLPDAGRATLAEIAQRLGRKVLEELAGSRRRIRCWPGTESASPTSYLTWKNGLLRSSVKFW